MAEYNWDERHIITFPEENSALTTKDLHVYYGEKKLSRELICNLKKIKLQP